MFTRHVRLVSVMVVVLGAPAAAQDTFTLTEHDIWKPMAEVDPASPEGQLAEARRALVAGDAERAEALVTSWIERHELHPLIAHAYLLRGDALLQQDDEYKALFDYEVVARVYPGSDAFVTALQREFEIAKQYAAGRNRKLWGIRWVGAEDEAQELLIRIQERLPGSRLGEQAGMELADYYDRKGEKRLAADAYDLFIENYPNSSMITKARLKLIYAHLATYKGPQFDPAGLDEAKLKLRELKVTEPATAQRVGTDGLLLRIQESEAAKLLVNARWYLQTRDPVAAERTIRRLVLKYPRTVAAQDALALIPKILPRLPKTVLETLPDYEALRQDGGAEPAAERSSDAESTETPAP
jgi:outer membrane protein assembly factor BamD (BamD/ComL family)